MKIELTWTSDRTAFIKIDLTGYIASHRTISRGFCDNPKVEEKLDKILNGFGFTRIRYWRSNAPYAYRRASKVFECSVIWDNYIDDHIP